MLDKDLLKELLEVAAPSGGEEPIQEKVFDFARECSDEIDTDLHGNLIACVNKNAPVRVMIAALCDREGGSRTSSRG